MVREQVVVLGQVLAADINIGYEDMVNTRVSSPQIKIMDILTVQCTVHTARDEDIGKQRHTIRERSITVKGCRKTIIS